MSDFDSNPFADPEGGNPFGDPSVQQVAGQHGQQRPVGGGLDDYNPFQEQNRTPAAQMQSKGIPPPQPAVMHPTEQPPAYTPSPAQPAQPTITTEELTRRQEELERKAAELDRKEEAMKNMNYNARQNNFPPLPEKCCVQPCFYQDFNVDIPLEFQRLVKTIYYLWLFYVCLLVLNCLGALAYFIASMQDSNINNNSGITFGLSILYVVLYAPCSFVCWYRPVYKAFRSDSSFNFFVFFFIFFFQFCVTILQCLGFDGWGTW
jgi:hypothetical protein